MILSNLKGLSSIISPYGLRAVFYLPFVVRMAWVRVVSFNQCYPTLDSTFDPIISMMIVDNDDETHTHSSTHRYTVPS